MKTYPIMLDVRGKSCVVVGAGDVGLRKAKGLLAAGARVRLVDERPVSPDGLDGVEIIQAAYAEEQLAGALLVFACTDDRAVNARVAQDARSTGAMVNAADQPEDCDFFAPAVVAEGDVIIAIGTGGSAPGLAAFLRRMLTKALPQRIGEFAAELAHLRDELRNSCPDNDLRIAAMKTLAGEQGYNAFVDKGRDGLRELLRHLLRRND
jgi:siroheme synthase-like protein